MNSYGQLNVLELSRALGLVSVHCNFKVNWVFELSKKEKKKNTKKTKQRKEKKRISKEKKWEESEEDGGYY